MKFIISKQKLNNIINKCYNIVGNKPATVPILSNFLIEAKNGELTITATDLMVGVRCFTEVKILEEGSTTLPAKQFTSLVRELTSINVEISTNEHHLTEIVADTSRFKINGMSGAEYPELPEAKDSTPVKICKEKLKEMFYRTVFSVSRDDNRYELTGVYLEIENRKATFYGTDGKRLSRSHIDFEIDPGFKGKYIVPHKAVDELLKNLDGEGDVTLHLMSDKIALETENTYFVTKLLSGEYPDVTRVIPERSETTVSLHRDELMILLKQLSLFAEEDEKHSVMFTFKDGEVKLNAHKMEVGEGKVSMPVNYHGPQLDIAFNPEFFLDILRHTKGETVMMGVTDSFNPGVLTDGEGGEVPTKESSPLYVLMPMRLPPNP